MRVHWKGAFFTNSSIAIVNRRLVSALLKRGNVEISLGTSQIAPSDLPAEFRELAAVAENGIADADVTVVHDWPPRFAAPANGRYVHFQPWEYGSIPVAWYDALHDDCDDVWTYSTNNRDAYVEGGLPEERVSVMPLGIDPAYFSPQGRAMQRDGSFRFLYVGGTITRKGIDVLIDAYARAFTRRDPVTLVVKDANASTFYKGQSLGENLRMFAQHPGMPRLEYVDATVSDTTMGELYRSADCLVLPYRGEGFGLPVLEAMACGLPVMASAGGATDDFVDESVGWRIPSARRNLDLDTPPFRTRTTPWLLEPNTDELARLMRYAYEHRDEVKSRGAAAAVRAHGAWTWEHAAERVESRFDEVVKREPVAAKERARRFADASLYAENLGGPGKLDGILLEVFARLGSTRRQFSVIPDDARLSLARVLAQHWKWKGLAAHEISSDLDFLAIETPDALGTVRPRVVGFRANGATALPGYACVAIDPSCGDRLFVRTDLAERAAFATPNA